MSILGGHEQLGDGAIKAIESNLENVGNTNVTNINLTIMTNFVNNPYNSGSYYSMAKDEYIEQILPFAAQAVKNPNSESVKRKIQKTSTDYCLNSIDMEEAIKSIYLKCYKICVYNLEDEIKYRTIKNLIDMVQKITKQELEAFKKIIQPHEFQSIFGEHWLNIQISTDMRNRIKSFGLIDEVVDNEHFNRNINSLVENIERRIKSIESAKSSRYSYLGITNNIMFGMHNQYFSTLYYLTHEGVLLKTILEKCNGVDVTDANMIEIIGELDKILSLRKSKD